MKKEGRGIGGGKELTYRIGSLLELPSEVTQNLPLFTMAGSQKLSIENYRGVIEYSPTRIRINTSVGIIKIEGTGLNLAQVTSEIMEINGNIISLTFTR